MSLEGISVPGRWCADGWMAMPARERERERPLWDVDYFADPSHHHPSSDEWLTDASISHRRAEVHLCACFFGQILFPQSCSPIFFSDLLNISLVMRAQSAFFFYPFHASREEARPPQIQNMAFFFLDLHPSSAEH